MKRIALVLSIVLSLTLLLGACGTADTPETTTSDHNQIISDPGEDGILNISDKNQMVLKEKIQSHFLKISLVKKSD